MLAACTVCGHCLRLSTPTLPPKPAMGPLCLLNTACLCFYALSLMHCILCDLQWVGSQVARMGEWVTRALAAEKWAAVNTRDGCAQARQAQSITVLCIRTYCSSGSQSRLGLRGWHSIVLHQLKPFGQDFVGHRSGCCVCVILRPVLAAALGLGCALRACGVMAPCGGKVATMPCHYGGRGLLNISLPPPQKLTRIRHNSLFNP